MTRLLGYYRRAYDTPFVGQAVKERRGWILLRASTGEERWSHPALLLRVEQPLRKPRGMYR